MERKFKIGDIVGAISNDYYVTSKENKWIGVVTRVRDNEFSAKTLSDNSAKEFHDLFYEDFRLCKTKIVKQNKYEPGDKVKIIDHWVNGCGQNSEGEMDHWLGKTMTIKYKWVDTNTIYSMEEDNTERGAFGWAWNNNCIEGKVVYEPSEED